MLALQTVRTQGMAGLYRGFGPALARSVPTNGIAFVVYELARTALGKAVGVPAPACKPSLPALV